MPPRSRVGCVIRNIAQIAVVVVVIVLVVLCIRAVEVGTGYGAPVPCTVLGQAHPAIPEGAPTDRCTLPDGETVAFP